MMRLPRTILLGLVLSGLAGAAELRLDDLLDQVLSAHPEAEAIRLSQSGARAGAWSSLSGALPQASYSAGWTRYEAIGAANLGGTLQEGDELQSHTLTLTQPLFAPGRFGAALGGWHALQMARQRELSQLAGLAYTVKAAYVEWASAKALHRVAASSMEFAERQLARARQMEEVGSYSRIDRLFIENSEAQARIQLERAILSESATRHELERLLGSPIDPDDTAQDLASLELAAQGENLALRELPEWRILKEQLGISRGALLSASGSSLPTLSGFLSWSNAGSDPFTYDADYTNRTIGVSLSWSLFRSGGNLADGWAAWQAARSARRQLEAAELSLNSRLTTLDEQIASTGRQVELARQSRDIALENLKLLEQKYGLGLLDATDLISGEQNLRSAESGLVQARAERLKSGWGLQRLEGRW